MNFIHLIGDPEETFYQLGLKDKTTYRPLYDQLRKLTHLNSKVLDHLMDEIFNWGGYALTLKSSNFRKKVKAYNEAIGLKEREMITSFIIPELLSCLSKWIPGLPPQLFGCSSYFMLDELGQTLHGRILDFPLVGTYENEERALRWDVPGVNNQIFSYSSSGLPFSSLTAMNSYGVSVALHQKYTDHFNIKGTPIFEIAEEMLLKCGDKKSVLSFLKNSESLTTWGLYIGFADGQVLEVDLRGEEIFINEFRLEENQILYFNNINLGNHTEEDDSYFMPYGVPSFCQMRKDTAEEEIQSFFETKKEKSSLNLLKLLSFPKNQKTNLKDWKLSPITQSSISCSTFNLNDEESLFIPGPAPKYIRKEISQFKNIWSRKPLQEKVTLKSDKKLSFITNKYHQGMKELISAQTFYDKHDFHMAYHFIQASIETLDKLPEKFIAKFFFAVFEFIHEPHTKARGLILQEFKELKGKLPSYLNDHCLLFINRLQVLISGYSSLSPMRINHIGLREVFYFERNIPRILLYKTISPLMRPRIELLDVIYGHISPPIKIRKPKIDEGSLSL
ncbi:MAG: hypothetical protein VXY34_01925 [Bdellovibrionota bacterium]|nr:hypothetical protein [Bdellovibrionota bacterium]